MRNEFFTHGFSNFRRDIPAYPFRAESHVRPIGEYIRHSSISGPPAIPHGSWYGRIRDISGWCISPRVHGGLSPRILRRHSSLRGRMRRPYSFRRHPVRIPGRSPDRILCLSQVPNPVRTPVRNPVRNPDPILFPGPVQNPFRIPCRNPGKRYRCPYSFQYQTVSSLHVL